MPSKEHCSQWCDWALDAAYLGICREREWCALSNPIHIFWLLCVGMAVKAQSSVPCCLLYFLLPLAQKCLILFNYFKMTTVYIGPINVFSGKIFWYKEDLQLSSTDSFQLIWNKNFCFLLICIYWAADWEEPIGFPTLFLRSFPFYSNIVCCSLKVYVIYHISTFFVLLFCSLERPFLYFPAFHFQERARISLYLHLIQMCFRNV